MNCYLMDDRHERENGENCSGGDDELGDTKKQTRKPMATTLIGLGIPSIIVAFR